MKNNQHVIKVACLVVVVLVGVAGFILIGGGKKSQATSGGIPVPPSTLAQIPGEIKSLDVAGLAMTLKSSKIPEEVTRFILYPGTNVSFREKQSLGLKELHVGDRVTVHYKEEAGKRIAEQIIVELPKKMETPDLPPSPAENNLVPLKEPVVP